MAFERSIYTVSFTWNSTAVWEEEFPEQNVSEGTEMYLWWSACGERLSKGYTTQRLRRDYTVSCHVQYGQRSCVSGCAGLYLWSSAECFSIVSFCIHKGNYSDVRLALCVCVFVRVWVIKFLLDIHTATAKFYCLIVVHS